jgi:hypothetical protein
MLPETRQVCEGCLAMIAGEVDLKYALQCGARVSIAGDTLKEIVARWPRFLRFAVHREEAICELVVPSAEAHDFVRTLARAVMH